MSKTLPKRSWRCLKGSTTAQYANQFERARNEQTLLKTGAHEAEPQVRKHTLDFAHPGSRCRRLTSTLGAPYSPAVMGAVRSPLVLRAGLPASSRRSDRSDSGTR